MKFLMATENEGKIAEMDKLLSPFGIDLVTPKQIGLSMDAEETGATFLENARIKSAYGCNLSGLPSIAEDSGLCVDFLGGEPGVHSKRFGTGDMNDHDRNMLLLEKLRNAEHRSAKFVSTIVCTFPNGDEIASRGECEGIITDETRGQGGFGYDPVFYVPSMKKTMAEMTMEEKNSISHRGICLRDFGEELEKYLRQSHKGL